MLREHRELSKRIAKQKLKENNFLLDSSSESGILIRIHFSTWLFFLKICVYQ